MLVIITKSMKKWQIILLIVVGVIIIATGIVFMYYNNNLKPVDKDDTTIIEVEIPENSSAKQIGKILEDKGLIRSSTIFYIYVRLNNPGKMNHGTYKLSRSMSVEEIIEELKKTNTVNPNEISITFEEGITMRQVAQKISEKTNNSYESVLEKANDPEYIDKLIEKYWFITDDIKNDDLKYKLEGYLFPDTYRFSGKDATVEEIFGKMLDAMKESLDPLKADIEKSGLTVHQILTLASMVEKEAPNNDNYRKNIASTFLNRIERKMSLGSDVTTYYAQDIDNAKKYIEDNCEGGRNCINYNYSSPYNTRLTDGSMNGKLPVGPIATISLGSLKASVYPSDTDYIYFISNIETREMFFYNNATDFEKKKAELNNVNKNI